jgi:nitrite reductase (NO-forming)
MQTVLLGSSGAAIVEFVIPQAGNYVMVDHHFANASQGAIGIIAAGGSPEGTEPEHHNIPATAAPTDPNAQKGKLAFESKCLACHSIAGGDKLGPDLHGVTKRRDAGWLVRWLKSPEQMLETDATAKGLLDKYKIPMPNQGLNDPDIAEFVAYFRWADENLQPKGTAQPQPAAPGTALPPSQTKSGNPAPAKPAAGERR